MELVWDYRLSRSEVAHVEHVARGAMERARQRGGRERDGGWKRANTEFDRKANGFAAEILVARIIHHDDEWLPKIVARGAFRDPGDASGKYEVRQTDNHRYRLIVKKKDKPNRPVILVTGTRHEIMYARGWVYASEGQQDRWWDDGPRIPDPNYFLPQTALHPMEDIF